MRWPRRIRCGRAGSSFGVAELGPDESESQCNRRLDEALYRAKGEGRNRVCMAESAENATEQPKAR
ncbi:hypothetical protein HOP51_07500 [Halomonas sp. MCCC 1A11036]|uniref:GGDEF domain-containing protein n=1 Tax=Billgrantia zhangzhouensis TaxID=2733481 RepID=A0ABS9AE20_9GAMM|nr:hypothetical protein [Halomonas zhangzhouensis]MCE8019958.1 hypothetical protein [Halomonas zhangzhouensis]